MARKTTSNRGGNRGGPSKPQATPKADGDAPASTPDPKSTTLPGDKIEDAVVVSETGGANASGPDDAKDASKPAAAGAGASKPPEGAGRDGATPDGTAKDDAKRDDAKADAAKTDAPKADGTAKDGPEAGGAKSDAAKTDAPGKDATDKAAGATVKAAGAANAAGGATGTGPAAGTPATAGGAAPAKPVTAVPPVAKTSVAAAAASGKGADAGTAADAPGSGGPGRGAAGSDASGSTGPSGGSGGGAPPTGGGASSPVPAAAPPPRAPERSGPGFLPLVLGGLVAGAIGYAIPTFLLTDDTAFAEAEQVTALRSEVEALEAQVAANGSVVEGIDLAPLNQAQTALDERIAALEGRDFSGLAQTVEGNASQLERIAGNEGAIAELRERADAVTGRLDELGAGSDGLAGRLDEMTARLDDLGGRVDEAVARVDDLAAQVEGIAPLSDEFASLRDTVETRLSDAEARVAEIETLSNDVEAEAEALAREAAINQIRVAVQAGGVPYAESLQTLGGSIPVVLNNSANAGVPDAEALREDFPPLAREAIRTARAETTEEAGFRNFLARATGARSVEPREGNDADAILSRAEDAIRRGDLAAALDEVRSLPDGPRAAFDDWIARADTRVRATAALQDYLSAASSSDPNSSSDG
ncbi:hypothetical protein [Jannaschia sp. LMIT008]|uniref:COG4223 family protein n=1 Tax=Jannaschia maritima TaxID=3032585 RepID=UPI0028115EE3|nr:hypothetical protein [Jannaschia sp. LMIT008]